MLQGDDDWWGGCPLENISSTPPILPTLQPTQNHSVLFHPMIKVNQVPKPFPDCFRDVWDSNHVRMPCSQHCLYPVELSTTTSSNKSLQSRWELIQSSLRRNIVNSYDLEKSIMMYNSIYSKKWKFDGLHLFFDKLSQEKASDFFTTILPRLVSLALQLPTVVTHAVPLLRKHDQHLMSFTQQQVACLLANAFLCTFPRRNSRSSTAEYSSYPSINFNTLYSSDTPG